MRTLLVVAVLVYVAAIAHAHGLALVPSGLIHGLCRADAAAAALPVHTLFGSHWHEHPA